MIRTYDELCRIVTYEGRYRYLRLNGIIGVDTFGFDRHINQKFYKSREWKSVRDFVIFRDNGCDLGIDGYEVYGKIIIHHMNPIVIDDIITKSEYLMNPEYLITTTQSTHNAIHYGDEGLLIKAPVERIKNDTCPWKH